MVEVTWGFIYVLVGVVFATANLPSMHDDPFPRLTLLLTIFAWPLMAPLGWLYRKLFRRSKAVNVNAD